MTASINANLQALERAQSRSRGSFSPGRDDDEVVAFERFAAERQADALPRIMATPFVYRDPRTIPPRRWLYGRHFIRRYATATIAPGGLGKSSLELVEALAMVTGRNLLGAPVKEPLRIWYWNGEDPREEVERRLMAACLHYGITADEIGDRLFIDSGRETPIRIATRQRDAIAVAQPLIDALVAEIRERRIDLIIIDPFVSCHDVPENDNGAVDRVTKAWAGIAEAANCGVELVHHVRKAGAGQTSYSVEDARGGSAMIGAVRSARVLNGMSPEEASQAGIETEHRRRYFRVDDGKANMQPPSDGAAWHHLVSVELGNETTEAPGDWVGVVTEWSLPALSDALSPGDLRKVQEAIDGGTWADNSQSKIWAGKAVAEVLGLDPADKGARGQITRLLTLWKRNGTLKTRPGRDTRAGRDITLIVVGERV